MLIVDAQIHLWSQGIPTNALHRQIPSYSAEECLMEMNNGGVRAALIHPPGWDPNSLVVAESAAVLIACVAWVFKSDDAFQDAASEVAERRSSQAVAQTVTYRTRTSVWTPACSRCSSRCQSRESSWLHSRSCASSPPMKRSFFPGCVYM